MACQPPRSDMPGSELNPRAASFVPNKKFHFVVGGEERRNNRTTSSSVSTRASSDPGEEWQLMKANQDLELAKKLLKSTKTTLEKRLREKNEVIGDLRSELHKLEADKEKSERLAISMKKEADEKESQLKQKLEAAQEEAKASAQSLQETLAAKREVEEEKELAEAAAAHAEEKLRAAQDEVRTAKEAQQACEEACQKMEASASQKATALADLEAIRNDLQSKLANAQEEVRTAKEAQQASEEACQKMEASASEKATALADLEGHPASNRWNRAAKVPKIRAGLQQQVMQVPYFQKAESARGRMRIRLPPPATDKGTRSSSPTIRRPVSMAYKIAVEPFEAYVKDAIKEVARNRNLDLDKVRHLLQTEELPVLKKLLLHLRAE